MQELGMLGLTVRERIIGGKDFMKAVGLETPRRLSKPIAALFVPERDSLVSPGRVGFCRDEAIVWVQLRSHSRLGQKKTRPGAGIDGKNRPRDAVNRHRNSRELGRKR